MTVPRLTVLTGVYNGERFLDEAIRSVLAQDFRDFEYIVVDDASTDRTPEILARWAATDPRIILMRNERNLGHSASLNRALRVARAPWIAQQDADDLSEPGRFSQQMAYVEQHPDVVVLSTEYRVISDTGPLLRRDRRSDVREVVEYFLRFANVIGGHSQVMFRRDDALAVGGYNESYRSSEDYDLWTRLAARGGVVILPFYGMRYRLQGASVTHALSRRERMNCIRVIQRELALFLGREIGEREALAVQAVGSAHMILVDGAFSRLVPLADRLFAEGEARLSASGARPAVLKRVRRRTARRFGETALLALVQLHEPRAAILSLLSGIRRHPWHGAAGAMSLLVREIAVLWRVRRRRRQGRGALMGAGAPP